MPLICSSTDADLDAITAIYAHHVLHGTGTFETTPPSAADMATRRADVLTKGLPWLVLEDDNNTVLGFAYGNWFKPRPAYRFSVEDAIYLAPESAGKGLGRALLAELMTALERAGVRRVMAVIDDSAYTGSIGVHRAFGFEPASVINACSWKFGRWLDIVFMQRSLGASDSSAPEATA